MSLPRALLAPLAGLLLAGAPACSNSTETGGAGGDVQCDTFKEPASLATATIHVTNKRATSIFVDACSSRFSVAVGGATQLGEMPSWWPVTCESAKTSDWLVTGCESGPTELAAGASFDVQWNGLFYGSETMPDGCYPDKAVAEREQVGEPPAYACFQGHAVAPGQVEVVFHFLSTDMGGGFDVTQMVDFAGTAMLSVDVN